MHLQKECAIIQSNLKCDAFEENEGQRSFKRAGGWCKSGSEAVRSTFQAAGEEPEGGTLYRTNKRPDRFVRQFGWQRGIFRPIGKGRKIPFLF